MTRCDGDTADAPARIGYCMGCHQVRHLGDFLCRGCVHRVTPDYARLVRRVHTDPAFAAMVHARFRGTAAGERFVRELGYDPGRPGAGAVSAERKPPRPHHHDRPFHPR